MVIKEQGWWWRRSYSLGGGVALLGRLNALLGCVWHANCHGFWRGGRAFERVGQECVKWRGEVTKVRFHFLLVTWPQIISFFLSSNSPTVSCNQHTHTHTHFLLLLALLFQTLLFIFYSFFSRSFSLPFMSIQTLPFQNLLFVPKS